MYQFTNCYNEWAMIDLKDKKIAVLGLGVEGEDVARFLLAKKVADVTVFDRKPAAELGPIYQELQDKGITLELGPEYLKDGLKDFDIIFRSPAFKLSLPELVAARKAGATIASDTKLFFELCPAKIIGVTGTKGKGTTVTLIYEILKADGKKVYLAGNIGQPMLALLPKLTKKDWVVLELSSFQLQDLEKSPHIAVVLFITSEHLDYHKDTAEYVAAKANIVRHQAKSDFVVLNADNSTAMSFAKFTPAQKYYFSRRKKVKGGYVADHQIYLLGKTVGETKNLKLLGVHNWENVTAAITAAHLAGAPLPAIKEAVFSFAGLKHRLELVKTIKGISFYNDSFSTTPETAIAAIRSFDRPTTLIAGGSDKGSDYTALGQEIAKGQVRVLILIGQMANNIQKMVLKAGYQGKIILWPGKMAEIVARALSETAKGGVVLLSPACASFDMFKNYKDRGNQFKKYVQNLSS